MPIKLVALSLVLAMAHLTAGPAFAAGTDESGAEQPAVGDLGEAKTLLKSKDYPGALKVLKPLSKSDAGNADVWNLLGFAQRKSGDLKSAGVSYDKALSLKPNHVGALEYQGELFVMTKEFDKAKANLERLRSICGSCEEVEDLAAALAKAGA